MSSRSLGLSDAVHGYLLDSVISESELQRELRRETAQLPRAGMQISPEQGRFMAWLVQLIGARRCLEVGVFTGYSALTVAMALPEDGSLVACDIDATTTAVARRYFERAGVASKIDLVIAPAARTLDALLAGGQRGTFDFAFVDAEKTGYPGYYEQCLALLRQGGVMAFDNALWGGKVADPAVTDADTQAIRALIERARGDARVDASLIPIGDGLLLLRKR